MKTCAFHYFTLMVLTLGLVHSAEPPIQISGVYPHLTMRNDEGECGTGAVVPWQGDLWAVTYAPHKPKGSSDKLYQISPELVPHIFAGSVGGTPANRMIHRESNQLLIGPYLIDATKQIRVLPSSKLFGRITGNARHLSDPANKVYYATMEEGLYEVDIRSLDVNCLIRDNHADAPVVGVPSELPGYHGKGLYSGQGRLIYSNNGEHGPAAHRDPTTASGALAQWFGRAEDWQLVRRNQFTEVTGPGGIEGNTDSENDPIWAMGWDARSVILALLEAGEWHYYRLPKASHSYDGAHGWNTEWPRIREIGEGPNRVQSSIVQGTVGDFLATMHGTFWRFPTGFSRKQSAGIAPRSNYLKVIGDFCRWQDHIVFGCDDSAKSEFLNTREFKASQGSPKQSNSNLWFVEPDQIDHLGPSIGRGSVWLREDVAAGQVSDPFLFSGYDHRQLHLTAASGGDFILEIDCSGNDQWTVLREISLPAAGAVSHIFTEEEIGTWIRLKIGTAASGVSAHFQYRDKDERSSENDAIFSGLATAGTESAAFSGEMRSLGYDKLGLATSGNDYYEVDQKLQIQKVELPGAASSLLKQVRQPIGSVMVDAASVMIKEEGKTWRLPKNDLYKNHPEEAAEKWVKENLAQGAIVKVSSTHGDNPGSHAVDGKLGDDSRWIGKNDQANWIELDLGEPKTVRSIWVVSGWKGESQYAVRDFDIQVKRGDAWETLPGAAIRANDQMEREILLGEPVTAQNFRLAAQQIGFLRIQEVALFERSLPTGPVTLGPVRICREVATERDLLNLHGTFYELPARNAQGLAKVRPIATHNLSIHDFCSHQGLLFFTGLDNDAKSDRIFRSADGKAALWAGVVDDLWKLGKPRGKGGPWNNTLIKAGVPSDPYLMTAYDKKSVVLESSQATNITLEVDIDGTGLWIPCQSISLSAGGTVNYTFPVGFSAYWVRAISEKDTEATVQFTYE